MRHTYVFAQHRFFAKASLFTVSDLDEALLQVTIMPPVIKKTIPELVVGIQKYCLARRPHLGKAVAWTLGHSRSLLSLFTQEA